MKRKVVKQGKSTLMISLPSKWVKDNNINRGDEIDLQIDGKNLAIKIDSKQKKRTKVHIKKSDKDNLQPILSLLYYSGYEEIELTFDKIPKDIERNVSEHTGLEIIQKTKNSVTLKSFLNNNPEQIENLIIKLFQMVLTLIKEIDTEWSNFDKEIMKRFVFVRMTNHCYRLINTNNYGGVKSADYYYFIHTLARIGINFYWFGQTLSENKMERTKLFDDMKNLFEESYQVYLKKDFGQANKLLNKYINLLQTKIDAKKIRKLSNKEDPLMLANYYATLRIFSPFLTQLMTITAPIES